MLRNLASLLWAVAIAAAGVIALAGTTSDPAQAADCGALNQVPCPVWVRVPSCDNGLVEDFAIGKCVKPQPLIKPVARPAHCGREGQVPCTIIEFIPSCDGRLVENFLVHKCVKSEGDVVNSAKDMIAQSADLLAQTLRTLEGCLEAQLLKAKTDESYATLAQRLERSTCIGSLIEGAHKAGYKTMTLGVSGGGAFVLGVDGEAGFAFDTARELPTTQFVTLGYSLGPQWGATANLVVGYHREGNQPGEHGFNGDHHGATIGFAAVGGSGAGGWFKYDGNPAGVSVALTSGGEFGAAYARNTTQVESIPGLEAPAPHETVTAPELAPAPQATISGTYAFATDSTSLNTFEMIGADRVRITPTRNGVPGEPVHYARIDAILFRAETGPATYEVLPDGTLLWLSNDEQALRVELRPM